MSRFSIGFVAAGAAPAGPVTFRASGAQLAGDNLTSYTNIPLPAGYLAGDVVLLLATFQSLSSKNSTVTTPAGWTLDDAQHVTEADTTTDSRQSVWHRVMTGAEGTSVTLTFSNNVFGKATTHAFSGVDSVTPIEVVGTGQTGLSGTSMTAGSITTLALKATTVALYGLANTTTASTPATGTVVDKQSTEYLSIVVTFDKTPAGSVTPSTITLGASGIRRFASLLSMKAAVQS